MPTNIKINFSDTYTLMRLIDDTPPETGFFSKRYFPTREGDLFKQKKVPVAYKSGDLELAPFVSRRLDPINIERDGFEISEYEPAFISVYRGITTDDLDVPMFGETFFNTEDEAKRAVKLRAQDMIDLDKRISRREEWMAVNTMLDNACTIQEMVDARTKGAKRYISFYRNDPKEHIFTVSKPWSDPKADIDNDVAEMCQMLADHNATAQDIIVGPAVWRVMRQNEVLMKFLDRTLAFNDSEIREKILQHGIMSPGTMIFGGNVLRIFVVSTKYTNEKKKLVPYFPTDGVLVTFPGCGHTMYGSVVQFPYGAMQFQKITARRIPKFIPNYNKDQMGYMLKSAPLTAPLTYCPFAFAPNVLGD